MVKIYKKGQSLPLNTIVIALLVVIVLVVIVLAFTSNIGGANETIADNSANNKCDSSNPVMVAFPGKEFKGDLEKAACESQGIVVTGVSGDSENKVCCALN